VWNEELPNAKIFNVRLERGDAYKMLSGGGGGFGQAFLRDAEKVAHDVREGYVSVEAAERLYGVVLDAKGQVNASATAALRKAAHV
jgi:N-methylhydantoinase B